MPDLFSALRASSYSLHAYDRALDVVQENVTNASTPGYARQRVTMIAQRFQQDLGDSGGVRAGDAVSARDEVAESSVREQTSAAGFASESASQLNGLEQLFPLQGDTTISAKISSFFAAVSKWSVQPNDTGSRQAVLQAAGSAAGSIRTAASGLQQASAQVDGSLRTTVATINSLAAELRKVNQARQAGSAGVPDSGLDARLHNDLEELSQYANFTALPQEDGSVTVLLGGQTPLVVGGNVHPIELQTTSTRDSILSASGADISATLTGGSIGAQLQVRNQTIPQYASSLDSLASGFADQVNTVLSGGLDASGSTPATPLFEYSAIGGAAATLTVSNLTPDQLAGALPGAPGGNGNVLQLAALATAPTVGGRTFSASYGDLSAQAGRDLNEAQASADTHEGLVQQAKQLREQASGVSLDDEAAKLIELQRGYQATAKMVSILDQLTETVLGIIPGS